MERALESPTHLGVVLVQPRLLRVRLFDGFFEVLNEVADILKSFVPLLTVQLLIELVKLVVRVGESFRVNGS